MAKLNKELGARLREKFEALLLEGNFPSVEFKRQPEIGYISYNMMAYSDYWLRTCKLAHENLLGKGYIEGGFTSNRKNRNAIFLADIDASIAAITPEQINANLQDRFRGMFD